MESQWRQFCRLGVLGSLGLKKNEETPIFTTVFIGVVADWAQVVKTWPKQKTWVWLISISMIT